MEKKESEAAIAFLADKRGEILEVLRDDVGLAPRLAPGRPLTGVVTVECLMSAVRFLRALTEQSGTFGYELIVRRDDEEIVLQFGGVATERGFLVVGATDATLLSAVSGELQAAGPPEPPRDADLGTTEADEAVDDLVALCRRVVARQDEVRRLRAESAASLRAAAEDLRRLARALRGHPAPWPAALRGDVGDALHAAAILLGELADEERRPG